MANSAILNGIIEEISNNNYKPYKKFKSLKTIIRIIDRRPKYVAISKEFYYSKIDTGGFGKDYCKNYICILFLI